MGEPFMRESFAVSVPSRLHRDAMPKADAPAAPAGSFVSIFQSIPVFNEMPVLEKPVSAKPVSAKYASS